MVTLTTEQADIFDRRLAYANAVGVATLCLALALPVQAATFDFPKETVAVKLELPGYDCNDGSMLICITTPATQRAYLLAVAGDAAFVSEAYRVLLRRAVDAAGLSYYRNRLSAHTITRDKVIDELMGSAEYRALHP